MKKFDYPPPRTRKDTNTQNERALRSRSVSTERQDQKKTKRKEKRLISLTEATNDEPAFARTNKTIRTPEKTPELSLNPLPQASTAQALLSDQAWQPRVDISPISFAPYQDLPTENTNDQSNQDRINITGQPGQSTSSIITTTASIPTVDNSIYNPAPITANLASPSTSTQTQLVARQLFPQNYSIADQGIEKEPTPITEGENFIQPLDNKKPSKMALFSIKDLFSGIPTFDGSDKNLETFINICDRFSKLISEEQKDAFVTIIQTKIVGEALNRIQPIDSLTTWDEIKDKLIKTFRKKISYEFAQQQLATIKQKRKESVEEYSLRIRKALEKLNETTLTLTSDQAAQSSLRQANEKQAVQHFEQNLIQENLRIMVESANKLSLNDVISFAQQKELSLKVSPTRVCNFCNKQGHLENECLKKKAQNDRSKTYPRIFNRKWNFNERNSNIQSSNKPNAGLNTNTNSKTNSNGNSRPGPSNQFQNRNGNKFSSNKNSNGKNWQQNNSKNVGLTFEDENDSGSQQSNSDDDRESEN